jgi:hypothetical protein
MGIAVNNFDIFNYKARLDADFENGGGKFAWIFISTAVITLDFKQSLVPISVVQNDEIGVGGIVPMKESFYAELS